MHTKRLFEAGEGRKKENKTARKTGRNGRNQSRSTSQVNARLGKHLTMDRASRPSDERSYVPNL